MFAGEKRKMTFEGCMNWKWKARERDKETIEKDLKWCGLDQVDKEDRVQWKNLVAVEIRQRPVPERTTAEKGEREQREAKG